MRLFKQRSDDPGKEVPDGPWSTGQTEYEGRPMVLRLNTGLAGWSDKRGFSTRAAIAVQFRSPDGRGFPSPKETEALDRFEDEFVERFREAGAALVAVITTNGMREFVFYASEEQALRTRFREWAATPKSHRVQLNVRPDPSWTAYQSLLAMTSAVRAPDA